MKKNPTDNMTNNITLPIDCLDEFKTAMKIGYYKILLKNGLISDAQFESLMKMQAQKIFA